MKLIDSLMLEFEHEAQTTRKHLERLPEDKLEWRPHEKSFTTSGLASHIVECVSWTDAIFNLDEVDFDPATYKPYYARSVADLLKTFESNVQKGKQALAAASEADLEQPWRLKVAGRQLFERPKSAVFRDFMLSHLIHHRGQF